MNPLDYAKIGFEFEFFSNYNTETTKSKLELLCQKKILIFDKSHSDFSPTADIWKIEPDFSGGKKLLELVTGSQPYKNAISDFKKILKWIDENGYTTDRASIHINISFDEKKLGKQNVLSHMNILKFILDFDETYVYSKFPHRKGTVYAKSIK